MSGAISTWWILRPFPPGVRIALWSIGLALGAAYALFSFWPVTRALLGGDAPQPSVRELALYLLGLAVLAFFALVAGGVWALLRIQGELQRLREEDPRP